MRIFLLGFMGAGKSYLGRKLADRLNFHFVDLDEWLENEFGMTVSQVFSVHGEPAFREKEAACLRSTLRLSEVVIATGGGTPCFHENLAWMNEHGITVFLNAEPETIACRLAIEKEKRPLLQDLPEEQLLDFIKQKMKERSIFYNQAHLQLDLTTADSEAFIGELSGFLQKFSGSALK